ncbi:MAG: hypothetical protein ACM3X0_02890 [Bacteroidota bacterium]
MATSASFAIPPSALTGLAAIPPAAFQSLTGSASATSIGDIALLGGTSSIVELSGQGQVLAAGLALENSLQALQTIPPTATAASVGDRVQALVDAFNGLQQNIGSVQPLLGTLPDSALVDQLAVTLNAAASPPGPGGAPNLASLQGIGIGVQPGSVSGTAATPATLSLDRTALNAALASDPAGTTALLARASQPLLQQVAIFEAQAAVTSETPDNQALQGATVDTGLLQNLSADTVLNGIQLTDLNLAALGLDANSLQTSSTALPGSLSPTLLSPATTGPATATTDLSAVAGGTTAASAGTTATTDLAANTATTATATTATTTPAVAALPTSTPALNAAPATTPAATATAATTAPLTTAAATGSVAAAATVAPTPGVPADTVAADRFASAATQALQNLVDNPTLRALSNNLFNPDYAALVAAAHQNDFTVPIPVTRAAALPADLPGPVQPIERVRGIASYVEASAGFVRRVSRSAR